MNTDNNLTILGKNVNAAKDPDSAIIEVVPNENADINYVARFTCPEFTTICPITSQPDFGKIVIDYVPDKWLVESKSLKLFLQSFRNHGSFHEACTIYIAKRIIKTAMPRWLRIYGYWNPRGGIPIDVFFQTEEPLKGIYIDKVQIQDLRTR